MIEKTSAVYGQRAVDGLLKTLGREDPITLTAIFQLCRAHLHLGRLDTARTGLEQVLQARRNFFGEKHQDTLWARAELAMVYHALKLNSEAEAHMREVVHYRAQILGEEHGYTLWAINDLSKVYTDSSQADRALEMLDAMIPIVVRTLGEQHIGMNMTKYNLARAYNALGRWRDGETVLRKQIGSIPSWHPDYVAAITELAWVCRNLNRLDEAEELYLKAIAAMTAGRERGINVLKVRRIANELKEIYQLRGQVSKADELETEAAALIADG